MPGESGPPNVDISFDWESGLSPDDIWAPALDRWFDQIRAVMIQIMESLVPEIIQWMKDNAPWQDITGAARQGLSAEVVQDPFTVSLNIHHGVEYGYYLEVHHEGRYAILGRTVDFWGVQIWTRVQQVMGS